MRYASDLSRVQRAFADRDAGAGLDAGHPGAGPGSRSISRL